ncbi:uncharacterized protein LOC116266366 isoform X1 [Nymphaea colorata]|nr:uncharacterized protein LOC116266366 isoform X1 [Nymphaea colorata]
MESAIWDDSALIRAFDDAMTKYKVMHAIQQSGSDHAIKAENDAQGGEISAVGESRLDFSRNVEFHRDADNLLKGSTEIPASCDTSGEVAKSPALDENNPASDSNIKNSCTYASMDPASHGQFDGYATPEYADYSQLISKYNELEMQRQQVLQQIYQASYSNDQPSSSSCVSSSPWDVCCCTAQPHQLPTYQSVNSCLQSLCHPCYCVPAQPVSTLSPEVVHCAANSSIPATVPDSALGTANQRSSSCDSVVSLGIEAAERALASIKIKAFESNKACEGEQGGSQSSRSDTQISDLLTAWYSAGFYTGKYLAEQSNAKRL